MQSQFSSNEASPTGPLLNYNSGRITGKPEVTLSQKARWDILAC